MKKIMRLLVVALLMQSSLVGVAKANDWGCQVLLCLSNPAGPEAVGECVPPIERLWQALSARPPQPFPTCGMGGGERSNYANHQWASANFCPAQYLSYTDDSYGGGGWTCGVAGGVTVVIGGQIQSRVWWQFGRGTVLTQSTGATVQDDPTTSLERILRQQQEARSRYQSGD